MTKKMKVKWFSDPGHGWLRVKIHNLIELGIAGKISSFSYQRGQWAYLEEDCDASVFMQAAEAQGVEVELEPESRCNKSSAIRRFNSYCKPGTRIRPEYAYWRQPLGIQEIAEENC